MFDIGFSELLLISLVALLVLGPERLPVAARNAGRWIGQAKRAMNSIKTQMVQELDAEQLRQEFDSQPLRQLEQCLREGIQLEPTVAANTDTPALAAPGHSTP